MSLDNILLDYSVYTNMVISYGNIIKKVDFFKWILSSKKENNNSSLIIYNNISDFIKNYGGLLYLGRMSNKNKNNLQGIFVSEQDLVEIENRKRENEYELLISSIELKSRKIKSKDFMKNTEYQLNKAVIFSLIFLLQSIYFGSIIMLDSSKNYEGFRVIDINNIDEIIFRSYLTLGKNEELVREEIKNSDPKEYINNLKNDVYNTQIVSGFNIIKDKNKNEELKNVSINNYLYICITHPNKEYSIKENIYISADELESIIINSYEIIKKRKIKELINEFRKNNGNNRECSRDITRVIEYIKNYKR